MSVPADVVLKLMAPLFQRDYNVTCDNYFNSLGLALQLRSTEKVQSCWDIAPDCKIFRGMQKDKGTA